MVLCRGAHVTPNHCPEPLSQAAAPQLQLIAQASVDDGFSKTPPLDMSYRRRNPVVCARPRGRVLRAAAVEERPGGRISSRGLPFPRAGIELQYAHPAGFTENSNDVLHAARTADIQAA